MRHPLAVGTVVLGAVVMLFFALGGLGVFLLAREQQLQSARLTASLVEDGLTRTLDSAKSLLLTVRPTIQHVREAHPLAASGEPDWKTVEIITGRSLRFSPFIRQLVIADGAGRVIMDTHGGTTGEMLDVDALGLTEDARDTLLASSLFQGFMVGKEIPGRFLPTISETATAAPSSPRSLIPTALFASRDILAVAAINPASLRQILGHANQGPVASVCLMDMAGKTLLGSGNTAHCDIPAVRSAIKAAAASGASHTIQPIPGGRAIVALSSRYPVAVVSLIWHKDSVATWFAANRVIVFWGFVAAIGVVAAGALLMRETLHRLRLENRLALVSLTEAVFAHSAEAMLIIDRSRLIQAANPAFLQATGYPTEAVVKAPTEAFLSPARDASRHPEALPYWHLRCRDGMIRAVEYREAPLTRDALILTLNDITERIASQRALEAAVQRAELANQAKSEFLASMSHELRTPLNAILGFSELVQEEVLGPVSPPKYLEYMRDIHQSGAHLSNIINDLLDLAKIEAGSFDLDPENIDVKTEILTCCRLVSLRAENHGLDLASEIDDDLPCLFTDRQVFRQMMFNLLSNAIKFTPSGGAIRVGAHHFKGGPLHVFVRDTGIGISPNDQSRIFHAYERALNTETRKIQGSGLGLSLVKSMIETQGGSVLLKSKVGRGSTFTLVFPAGALRPHTVDLAADLAAD